MMHMKINRRLAAWLLALLLLLPALACAASYPVQRGAVNDDASVLSEQTAADIASLNDAARNADISFVVVTRHFLGGADAQSYCDGLFDAWNLDDDTVLLLLVIGEERYALTSGAAVRKSIGSEQINNLLASKLRTAYIDQRDYDGAVGDFLLALAAQAGKAQGVTVKTSGLFGTAQDTTSANNTQTGGWNWSGEWWNGFFSSDGAEPQYDAFDDDRSQYYYEESTTGFSMGKLIFIAVVLLIIVKNRRAKGKAGLGLLGWMVAGKGAKEMMKGTHRPPHHPHQPPRPPRRR